MAQAEKAGFTCGQCGARYNSERELNEHMKAAHHEGPGQNNVVPQRDDTEKDGSKIPSREEQKTSDREGAQDKVVPREADLRKAARLGRG
jgi:hypothetical protein